VVYLWAFSGHQRIRAGGYSRGPETCRFFVNILKLNRMKNKMLAFLALAASTVVASADALPVTELTSAIGDGLTGATTLVTAGFAITALFIVVGIYKKGARTAAR